MIKKNALCLSQSAFSNFAPHVIRDGKPDGDGVLLAFGIVVCCASPSKSIKLQTFLKNVLKVRFS